MKKVYLLVREGGFDAGYFVEGVFASEPMAQAARKKLLDKEDLLLSMDVTVQERNIEA